MFNSPLPTNAYKHLKKYSIEDIENAFSKALTQLVNQENIEFTVSINNLSTSKETAFKTTTISDLSINAINTKKTNDDEQF